ncbi:MAG: TolC family protein [Flavobacteriales bacterium]|nr:TolC family protein [Flavobacteriales bacterium]
MKHQPATVFKRIRHLLLICTIAAPASVFAQESLTLESCLKLARENYPLIRQHDLIEKSKEYSLSNATAAYLPQINIAGQATHQSDVTQVEVPIPNVEIPSVSKDQYKVYAEIYQPVSELTTMKWNKKNEEAASAVDAQKLEVDLYQINERVQQLYFGMLLINAQLKQIELLQNDLSSTLTRMQSLVANEVAIQADADAVKVAILQADQRKVDLEANRRAYADMLSRFTGQQVPADAKLQLPAGLTPSGQDIHRPETELFERQKQRLDIQSKLVTARTLPRIGLFFQGGIGQPSPLNMLSPDLATYYIGGVRLQWPVSAFYTAGRQKKIIAINQQMIDTQRDVFLFNTQLQASKQNEEMTRLQGLLSRDKEIVVLRGNIKSAAKAKLENGTITVNDYLTEVNAENRAQQDQMLHEVQLRMAQYQYQNTLGN